jgi:hypothetical protein
VSKPKAFSEGKSQCDKCGRNYVVKHTTNRLAQDAENPLFVRQVIQYYAEQYGQSIAMVEFVCPECVQQRWEEVLDANSVQYDHRGHVILSDNDEFFGRREDENGGGSVVTKPKQHQYKGPQQGKAVAQFDAYPEPEGPLVMIRGDYKGKKGMVLGQVRKGYWDGLRVRLESGREIDVQPTSFEWE